MLNQWTIRSKGVWCSRAQAAADGALVAPDHVLEASNNAQRRRRARVVVTDAVVLRH